nr:hypothetical protein CFP56_51645 [Quercus suber]
MAKKFNDLVLQICSSLSALNLELFFAISWSVWYNRNKLLHGENGLPPLQILDLAKSIVEDYGEAFLLDSTPLPSSQSSWVAPSFGYFKVNADGASSIDGNRISGIEVIIRDEMSRVVAALCKALPVHYPAKLTEFFALEHGVLLAQKMNISKVIFESDASSVISVVSQACYGGVMGRLVHSIQSVNSVLSCYSFSHMKKDYNRAAHELAQFAKCLVELSDQSHNEVTDMDNHQVSNLVSSDLVEDFPHGAHIGVNSKFDLVDHVLDLSLIPNQSTNFEFQLKEIDSKIQKFDNDKNPKPENQVISIMVPSGDFIGEDNGVNPSTLNLIRSVAVIAGAPSACPSHYLNHCLPLVAISERASSVHPSDCLCHYFHPGIISVRASSSYHSTAIVL